MKRTPIKRGKALARYEYMPRKRTKPRRVAPERVRDKAHLAKVRAIRECVSSNMPGARCNGPIQAAHRDEGKGAGLKTSDLETVPQCLQCHADWGANCGPFQGWNRERKRAWFGHALTWTRYRLERRDPSPPVDTDCPF